MHEKPEELNKTRVNVVGMPWLSVKIYDFNLSPNQFKELVVVGRGGLEPPTSRLSGVRSNHLSYRPS